MRKDSGAWRLPGKSGEREEALDDFRLGLDAEGLVFQLAILEEEQGGNVADAIFDREVGLGQVAAADGSTYLFHCIEIADGNDPVVSLQLTGVDYYGIIERVRTEDNEGARRTLLRYKASRRKQK